MQSREVGVFLVVGLCVAVIANAEPGDGININGWKISPKLGLSATHDSNVYSTSEDQTGDEYLDTDLGLSVNYKTSTLLLDGSVFGGFRSYSSETEKDFNSFGETLIATIQEEQLWRLSMSESFREVEDIDRYALNTFNIGGISSGSVLDSSSRTRRDVTQVALGAGRVMSDKIGMDIGYRYDDVSYTEGDLFDLTGNTVELETGMKATDKTAGILTLVYGTQESTGSDQNSDFIAARAGFKTIGTDKVTFKGGIGAQVYSRADESKPDENLMNYDLVATWKATDKVMINVGGRNGVQLSSVYADNPAEFNMVWLDGSLAFSPAAVLSAGVSYRQDDYLDKVEIGGSMIDRVDKGSAARIRMDYAPPGMRFAKLFCEGVYESVESDVSDYDDTRIAVGVNLQY